MTIENREWRFCGTCGKQLEDGESHRDGACRPKRDDRKAMARAIRWAANVSDTVVVADYQFSDSDRAVLHDLADRVESGEVDVPR